MSFGATHEGLREGDGSSTLGRACCAENLTVSRAFTTVAAWSDA